MHIKAIKAETEAELPEKMAEFLAHPGPVLLEVVTTNKEHVMPMVNPGKALHEMLLFSEKDE